MYVYNITFVLEHERRGVFLDWIRESALPRLFGDGSQARDPRLLSVAETGGEKHGPEHGLSIALQAEFDSEEKAHDWHDNILPAVLADFHRKFGPHAAYFATLLSVISI